MTDRNLFSVAGWPSIRRQVQGAEEPIDPGKNGSIIRINPTTRLVAVMPMMKGRTGKPVLERPQSAVNIGMYKISPQPASKKIRAHQQTFLAKRCLCEAREINESDPTKSDKHHIHRMSATGDQPIN